MVQPSAAPLPTHTAASTRSLALLLLGVQSSPKRSFLLTPKLLVLAVTPPNSAQYHPSAPSHPALVWPLCLSQAAHLHPAPASSGTSHHLQLTSKKIIRFPSATASARSAAVQGMERWGQGFTGSPAPVAHSKEHSFSFLGQRVLSGTGGVSRGSPRAHGWFISHWSSRL